MSRKVFYFAGASVIAILGLFVAAPAYVDDLVERNVAVVEWRGLTAAVQVVEKGNGPQAWAAATYVSEEAVNAFLDQLQGLTVTADPNLNPSEDIRLSLTDIAVDTRSGAAHVDLTVVADSESRGASLEIRGTGLLTFNEVLVSAEDGGASAVFTVDIFSLRPQIDWGVVNWEANRFVSQLLALGAQEWFDDILQIRLPFEDKMISELQLDKSSQHEFRDGSRVVGSLELRQRLVSPGIIAKRFSLEAPLFTSTGVWLLLTENDSGQLPIERVPNPEFPTANIREENSAMRSQIAQATGFDSQGLDLLTWISSDAVVDLFAGIGSLSPDQRRIVIESTTRDGRLSERRWRDDLLGDGGIFVELTDHNALNAEISIGVPVATFLPGQGMDLAVPVTMSAMADVEIHVDPLVGGGVGTSVGLVGSSQYVYGAQVELIAQEIDGRHVVLLAPKVTRAVPRITMSTDGNFKTDFGWTKLPSIGATMAIDLAEEALAPILLASDLPNRIALANQHPGEAEGQGRIFWPNRAIDLTLTPMLLTTTDHGYLIGFDAVISGTDNFVEDPAIADAKARLLQAVSNLRYVSGERQIDDFFAIQLGTLEFGPNNEIVKFFAQIGKLSQEFVDFVARAPDEVSAEKIRGWIEDPAGSLARGEIGRAAETILNDVTEGPGPNNDIVGERGWLRSRLGF